MSLKIYNTLAKNKQVFEPLVPKKIGLYVCGVTVYDRCHVGHARAAVAFDVIYRYLKASGFEVTYVRNFTDIDDKIIKRAQETKQDWKQVADTYIATFEEDMSALGNEPPTYQPRATDHLAEMIELIQTLIQKNLAYESQGDVFYRVRSFSDYGKLSHKNIEELESGARVEVLDSKQDPLDFALWKATKPGEPAWPSPWGPGRPGWHIECSAMSMRYLGQTFDLHAGGRDLTFPHHENEIAQSEGATGKPFARIWMHNGFVNLNSHKMSKSTGNFLTIQALLENYDWEIVRAFLLSVHYRSPIDFTDQNLIEMGQALERYYSTVQRIQWALTETTHSSTLSTFPGELEQALQSLQQFRANVQDAMDDDFNTALVFGLIFESIRLANKILDQFTTNLPDTVTVIFKNFLQECTVLRSVLGCFGTEAQVYLDRQRQRSRKKLQISEAEILKLIAERKEARLQKNFQRADEIRKHLETLNILLKDRPDGTTDWMMNV